MTGKQTFQARTDTRTRWRIQHDGQTKFTLKLHPVRECDAPHRTTIGHVHTRFGVTDIDIAVADGGDYTLVTLCYQGKSCRVSAYRELLDFVQRHLVSDEEKSREIAGLIHERISEAKCKVDRSDGVAVTEQISKEFRER